MSSADLVCCKNLLTLLTNVSFGVNTVDPEQTAPAVVAVLSVYSRFDQVSFKTFQQTTKADDICCGWRFNPFMANGISHCYQLDHSISVLRVVGWYFPFK